MEETTREENGNLKIIKCTFATLAPHSSQADWPS